MDAERVVRMIGAIADAATLGQALSVTHIASLGFREGLEMVGKVALIEFGSNLTAYGGMMLGDALGLPAPVTVVLGMMAGITVELSLGRLVFRGSDGHVLRVVEMPNPAEQVPHTLSPYRSFADGMSSEDVERYLYFLEHGSTAGLTDAELYGLRQVDDYLALQRIDYDELLEVRRGSVGGSSDRLIPGTEGVVTGGNSTRLGRNMMESMGVPRGTTWSGYQAQHIIPAEMAEHPVLQRIGIDLDDASNGLFLRIPIDDISTMSRHRGYHSTYNEFVSIQLDGMDINLSVDVLQRQVYDLQQNLKYLQQNGLPLYPTQGATVDLWQRSLERFQ